MVTCTMVSLRRNVGRSNELFGLGITCLFFAVQQHEQIERYAHNVLAFVSFAMS